MDTELARTFLAIVDTSSFKKAAEQLDVTQSTVSMRIKTLEEFLGQPVFQRGRAGTQLTAAGKHFHRYAGSLVRTLERACQEIAHGSHYQGVLSVGGQFTLWERLLANWIPWMQRSVPDLAIRAEVGLSDGLMRQLIDGALDIAVLYTPRSHPDLVIEELLVERLVFVASDPDVLSPGQRGYVYVDWGPEFRQSYLASFPDTQLPYLTVGYGPLALQFVKQHGGSGYFPLREVKPSIMDGTLHLIDTCPEFSRPVHMVYATERDDAAFKTALQGLRYIAASETEH